MDNGHSPSLTIREAAQVLGITPIAVRKRLLRGSLPGYKDDAGQWFVTLPGDMPPATVGDVHGAAHGAGPGTTGVVEALNRVIAQQREEIAFLRATLDRVGEARDEAERRRDILLSQFAEQMKALSQTTSRVRETVEAVAQEVVPVVPPAADGEAQPRPNWFRRFFLGES